MSIVRDTGVVPPELVVIPREEYTRLLNTMCRVAVAIHKLKGLRVRHSNVLIDGKSGEFGWYPGEPYLEKTIKGINNLCDQVDLLE